MSVVFDVSDVVFDVSDANDVSDVSFLGVVFADDSDSFEGLKGGSFKLGRCLWIRRTVSG